MWDRTWYQKLLYVHKTFKYNNLLHVNGGEGGIRTPVPITRQDAFEAPPLRPLRYLSLFTSLGGAPLTFPTSLRARRASARQGKRASLSRRSVAYHAEADDPRLQPQALILRTAIPEERLDLLAAFVLEHAPGHLDVVIERRMFERTDGRLDRAGLGLGRAVDEPRDPRVDHRPHAHLAGLDRHIQRRAGQSIVARLLPRLPQRDDLRVRRRIVQADGLVESPAQDLAVHDEDRTDRHFTAFMPLPRELQRRAHVLFVSPLA